MKNKTTITIVIALLLLVVGTIFKVYAYDSAKDSYCVSQTRQQFPEERGAPSQQWFDFYDKCRDDLGTIETFRLILGSEPMGCEDIARGYLEMAKNQNQITNFGGGNTDWQRAIAIESEINNLCQMELTDEALESYSPTNIQKYLDDYRHE
jgi:hypothetical protein